jgi:cold shock CspA family protein
METVGTFEMAKALSKVSIFLHLTKVRNRSFQMMREGYRVDGSRIL